MIPAGDQASRLLRTIPISNLLSTFRLATEDNLTSKPGASNSRPIIISALIHYNLTLFWLATTLLTRYVSFLKRLVTFEAMKMI